MNEREPKARKVNNGKAVQSVNPQKSSWLTHWKGTRSDASPSTNDRLTDLSKSSEDSHEIKILKPRVPIGAYDNFGSSKGIRDVDLAMSSRKPVNQSFPFFKIGPESARTSISNDEGPQVLNKKLTNGLNVETSSRECRFEQEEQVKLKYHMFFGESSYTSHIDTGIACEPENFRQMTAVLKDHLPKTNPMIEQADMPSFIRQNNPPLLKIDPSTSGNHSPAFIEEQYQRMQKHVKMGFFPDQTGCSQEPAKSTAMPHVPFSFQNLPHFVHSFSQTTHSLVITKQTEVNLFQENQIFRESRVSTQFDHPPPHFAHSQQGVKLQLLGSSSDHESQEGYVKTAENFPKNESSADTDAMDIESLHPLPRVEPDRSRKRKIELPDMNLELSSSMDKTEQNPSRTQSFDMNALHFNVDHVDQTSNSKSSDRSESNMCPKPENRWIKRLTLSGSISPTLDTKSSKLTQAFSHGKLNKFFTRVTERDKCHHKGSESETNIGKGESSLVDTKRECKDITLSHSWIQRWSRNQGRRNLETPAACKPDDGKLALEELQKKQFPSIAAMALMGKTMTGFQSCEFEKKESFVVWNTKGF